MKFVRVAVACLLGAAVVSGCDCDTVIQQSPGIFVLTPRSLDFGIGCVNETSERTVLLKNEGNAPLSVLDVRLTGAAFSLLEDPPSEIGPGDEIPLRIGLTPASADEVTGTLTVETDGEENPNQTVTFIGQGFEGERLQLEVTCACSGGECGQSEGHFAACNFLSFNKTLVNTEARTTMRVSNAGCAPLVINELRFVGDPQDDARLFSIDGESTFTVHGGTSRDVNVVFNAPATPQQPNVELHVASNDPKVKRENVGWAPGEWRVGLFADSVAPALLVDPNVLTYFEAIAGQPLAKTFVVANTGDIELTIQSIELQAEDGTQDFSLDLPNGETSFTLSPTGSPGDERTITVVYTSTGSGSDRAKVVVRGTSGESAEVRLIGGTEPLLDVTWLDPSSTELLPPVNFGAVDTGTKGVERTVRLRNSGQAPLNVSAVTVVVDPRSPPAFSVRGFSPTSVPPGGQHDVTVVFDDVVTVRNDSAKLEITSNDPVDAAIGGKRSVDLVSTNEPNLNPIAIIVTSAAPQRCATLDVSASTSSGPEPGDTLTYEWSFGPVPGGSAARFEDDSAVATRIVSDECAGPDVAGSYVVRLRVTDQFGNQGTTTQTVNVR